MNAESREGRTADDAKKKLFDLKSDNKKNNANFRQETQSNGGGTAGNDMSELDHCLHAYSYVPFRPRLSQDADKDGLDTCYNLRYTSKY